MMNNEEAVMAIIAFIISSPPCRLINIIISTKSIFVKRRMVKTGNGNFPLPVFYDFRLCKMR